ncbi:hypothetical protein DASC09_055440 [Saccharomycopsis crataegensis]|uniref:Uncharacterized protein n=1 Tax=Saccharomycopsis crataegensis TaxID=43959 RepID=A0AAV5QUD8_9ASCO|nr:hypothetical protein DASC09_055440 [Saccharomycopsis crataegensis]
MISPITRTLAQKSFKRFSSTVVSSTGGPGPQATVLATSFAGFLLGSVERNIAAPFPIQLDAPFAFQLETPFPIQLDNVALFSGFSSL